MSVVPCCRFFAVGATAILLATCSSGGARGEQVIRLGGVRNVTAVVSESNGDYRITVEMLPVRAFDPATDRALNLSKGRMYAVQALTKRLEASSLTIRGLEIRENGTSGGFFRLVAVVPQDGVAVRAKASPTAHVKGKTTAVVSRPPAVASTSVRQEIRLTADATAAEFLNRKADCFDTIVRLQETLSEEGESLERQSLKPDAFYDSVENLEERTETEFKTLARQVDNDNLLLSAEQDELRPALRKAHAEVLESLKAAVARFDRLQEKTNKEPHK